MIAPGVYVNSERTILIAIGEDGTATVAKRESRLDTWSPPAPATPDEIDAAQIPA